MDADCDAVKVLPLLRVIERTATNRRKVRLQTQSHVGLRKNMLQMFVHILRNEGLLGLYRGVSLMSSKTISM